MSDFILPYKRRVYKIPKPGPNSPFSNDDELYSFIINEWMPKQPDFYVLAKLFIVDFNFDFKKLLYAIFDNPGGPGKKNKKAA